ncbi:MAG TPA: hypothetical protein VFM14_07605 [Gemmatimonadales bacterium]|nr:hypothetical protein [Gemmatimonadales bacterium]
MTTPLDDDPLPPELRAAADAYNRPPETPREEMWDRIRMAPSRRPAIRSSGHPAIWFGLAAALLLAFGLGRWSSHPDTLWIADAPGGVTTPARGGSVAFRVAAVEHLGQAESFLTLFRASVRSGASQDRLASPTARQLLATNRLLLDSPASKDPKLRLLLQDLELVLAGIAQLSPARRSEDLDLINNDLERSAVLLRLRAAVPAGGAAPVRPGAL